MCYCFIECGVACISCTSAGAGKCDQGSCKAGYVYKPDTKQCAGKSLFNDWLYVYKPDTKQCACKSSFNDWLNIWKE